ncbi:probable inactive 1-aminocyclopropane-1-carboxylate synthase-like protein 2 [Palaemon carinicauda]|uniref:probable inactive 1-aminocyclopropane-1-carboxylate synthase-like protein 2 n=1 Tax=Palaemon carinicauda TaxID=392227 RepID=UPI0035B596A1
MAQKVNSVPGKVPDFVLSKRGQHLADYQDFLVDNLKIASTNPYSQENPTGIVNLGTAINRLVESDLASRLNQKDCFNFSAGNQHYCDFTGDQNLKVSIARFLERHLKPLRRLESDKIMIYNGVSSCLDAISHVLCDPGDVIITPTPIYARIFTDVHDAARSIVEPLPLSEEEDENGETFSLKPEELERKIISLRTSGKNVRCFLLVNPNNPLGDIYSADLIKKLLDVCAKYEVQFISDEIYALSLFEGNQFDSVLSLDIPDPSRTHFLWGFSKDFGLAGLRIGVIYSFSEEVVQALSNLSVYKCTPQIVQESAAVIIEDTEWCDQFYLPLNSRRLTDAYEYAAERLRSMGVEVRPGKAGLFIWANARAFLRSPTEEDEMRLHQDIFDAGVYVVPGTKLYCSTPGWFRLIVSVTRDELQVGLDRLEAVLKAGTR